MEDSVAIDIHTDDWHSVTAGVVNIKAPPFFRNNPDAWFCMLESQFTLRRISSEETRFHHLLCLLPEDIISVLLSADTLPNYSALKAAVINMVQRSKQERLQELLNVADLEGDRPSVFVRRLASKMCQCGIHPDANMIKATLLRCLPTDVQVALSGFHDQTPEHLASIADSMMAIRISNASVNAAGSNVTEPRQQSQFSHAQCAEHPRQMSSPAPFKPGQRPVICRAHIYYGARARTCRRWCQFPRSAKSEQPRTLPAGERTPHQSPERDASGNAAALLTMAP